MFFKTLIWLIWSRMNRREHSHLILVAPQPRKEPQRRRPRPPEGRQRCLRKTRKCNFLSKRVPPKSRSNRKPLPGPRFSRLCRPRFSFFILQLSKNRHRNAVSWAGSLLAPAPQSVAHAALQDFLQGRSRSKLLRRQRRAALVGEAYIVATHPNCQQRLGAISASFSLPKGRHADGTRDCAEFPRSQARPRAAKDRRGRGTDYHAPAPTSSAARRPVQCLRLLPADGSASPTFAKLSS